ncbi:MAG: helix-turn-helix domain containing protein, partial [bacterium]|nr:helix-turn-helix domain containing protein [bacterium]
DRSVQMLQRLRHLALTWHMSILVLAHSRYHNPSKPLSITNLAGSREFAFSFDTVFALGKISNPEVIHDPQAAMPPTHYIRQFKTRATPIIYDQDNAMRLNLAKREGILGFKIVDTFGIEAQLIAPLSDTFQTKITADILSLHAQGFSIRKIAHSLAVTPTTVYRILKNNPATNSPATNSPAPTQPHAHITNSV